MVENVFLEQNSSPNLLQGQGTFGNEVNGVFKRVFQKGEALRRGTVFGDGKEMTPRGNSDADSQFGTQGYGIFFSDNLI